MKTTDVLIAGGGVIGTACAWFLSEAGFRVTLLEQREIAGSAATGVSKGLLRVYEPIQDLAELAAEGMEFYRSWPKNLGNPVTIHNGLYYRIKLENLSFARNFCRQYHTPRYPVQLRRFRDVRHSLPGFQWNNDDFVICEPFGGYGDPAETARRFAEASVHKGSIIKTGCRVNSFHKMDSGQWLIDTSGGSFQAQYLVVATGAWTPELFSDLNISPRTIGIPVMESSQPLRTPVIDEIETTYMRPLDGNRFITGSQLYEFSASPYVERQASTEQIADSCKRAGRVLKDAWPVLEQNQTLGMDGYTPDFRPILDLGDRDSSLVITSGFSGRGYKMAPAVGRRCCQYLMTQANLSSALEEKGAVHG